MYLKRIDLENFKSFGRKVSIPFLEGFTAITGPNGSGKSNIGDAILFVLGPKSNRAIRAGKLTDLIFNGGKEKSGGAESCKVSLVFDNEDRVLPVDSDEVVLTRVVRISRSNPEAYNSYFYVNGRPSSLSEFDSLLAHSRISADGYNIVRQGDVARIVEMSPIERRRILDDVAGITRYDEDLARANEERAQVEENLSHIRIVLQEIERKLATLEHEKENALRLRSLKGSLELAKAKLLERRIQSLRSDLESVRREIELLEKERVQVEKEGEENRKALLLVEEKLSEIEKKIAKEAGPEGAQLRQKIEEVRTILIRSTERVHYALQEIEGLKENLPLVESDERRVRREESKIEEEKRKAEDRLETLEREHSLKREELSKMREALAQGEGRAAELERELGRIRKEHEEVLSRLHALELERDRVSQSLERSRTLLAELEERGETLRFEGKDAEWEEGELRKTIVLRKKEKEEGQRTLFELKKRESEISRKLKELDPTIRSLQNEYARLKAEADAHEALSHGVGRGVEAVLEARDRGILKGIHGTVASLAEVPEHLERALEVAAGGRLQAIVTETDEDAEAAIAYLKKHKAGRATFLPLSKMVSGRPTGKPLLAVRDPSALGFALDLIRFEEKYRAAFWYVLRDTVVVRDLSSARRLMGGVRLVTLEGELVDPQGAMTGGEEPKAQGRVRFGPPPRRELETLGEKLREALLSQETLSGELAQVRSQIEEHERTLRESSAIVTDSERRLEEVLRKKEEVARRLELHDSEVARVRSEIEESEKTLVSIQKEEENLRKHALDLERARDEKGALLLAATDRSFAQKLRKTEEEVSKLQSELVEVRLLLETKSKELSLLRERAEEIARRKEEIEGKIRSFEEEKKAAESLVQSKGEELQVLLHVESQLAQKVQELSQKREELLKERSSLLESQGRLQARRESLFSLLTQSRGRIPSLEEALLEAREEQESLPIRPPESFPESLEELRSTVRRIETEIESLGNVNMLALEEFERESTRKSELLEEVRHLEEERSRLEGLVEEINARKKECFFKVFDEINKNLQEVFSRLSEGGKAELSLENPENPFEGGLLLRAQPKGKKLTRLEALSGGEKSLASMALIFALQLYNPSPFYYLDEIDQNLDGINAENVARMIRENSAHAQHIAVSLRKVTLKEAEHVYGVTMGESGCSEIVGEVRLSEILDEPTVTVEGG